jgi:hypothetical protein
MTSCFQILIIHYLWLSCLFIEHYVTSAYERIWWNNLSINQFVKNITVKVHRIFFISYLLKQGTSNLCWFHEEPKKFKHHHMKIYVWVKIKFHVSWILEPDGSENKLKLWSMYTWKVVTGMICPFVHCPPIGGQWRQPELMANRNISFLTINSSLIVQSITIMFLTEKNLKVQFKAVVHSYRLIKMCAEHFNIQILNHMHIFFLNI